MFRCLYRTDGKRNQLFTGYDNNNSNQELFSLKEKFNNNGRAAWQFRLPSEQIWDAVKDAH